MLFSTIWKHSQIISFWAVILTLSHTGQAQKKIKPIKNTVSWSYNIAPNTPLDESMTTYNIVVDSHLSPMDWWDEISWKAHNSVEDSREVDKRFQEAMSDTLDAWSDRYMALNRSYRKIIEDPHFTVVLKTEEYQVKNVQRHIDFDNMESSLCEINARARLTVTSQTGDVLLDTSIIFYVEESRKSKWLPIRHFMLNPVFRMKYNLNKKPEQRRRLLNRKLAKYEADVLEYFFLKSGEILREQFVERKRTVHTATFGVKNKGHEALNDACSSAKNAIDALSALSKKRRKTLEEIAPDIEICLSYWKDKLERTKNPEIQKYLYANLSLGHLLMNDIKEAKKCIHQIPEFESLGKETQKEGEFTYYLKGITEAISIKEKYGDLAQIQ